MTKIEEIIEKLQDGAEALVDLCYKNKEEHRHNALFSKAESPCFELFFPPKSWNSEELLLGKNYQLTVKHKGAAVNIIAELDTVINDRRLGFIAREPIKPEALREYFRVSINTPIEIGYLPSPKEVKLKKWNMVGTTVDLSASGVLGLFAEKPESSSRIQISITDPASQNSISCFGHVVRTYRMRKNRYQVALHFESVSQDIRDRLIAFCLQEQRRQLRENIEVKY
ncbi:PilZ domain-containing protein [Desulfogranum marinum]|uniref:PilZ domain-containing protein n=1 Tax=Desulfogranum marinum TaxID=453220 RepID=UPI0029C7DA2C|nr:PilZ domain-containing protein [Desulfogranum marinum]